MAAEHPFDTHSQMSTEKLEYQLRVRVESGHNLPKMDRFFGRIDPLIKVKVNRGQEQIASMETPVIMRSYNPVWGEEASLQFTLTQKDVFGDVSFLFELWDWEAEKLEFGGQALMNLLSITTRADLENQVHVNQKKEVTLELKRGLHPHLSLLHGKPAYLTVSFYAKLIINHIHTPTDDLWNAIVAQPPDMELLERAINAGAELNEVRDWTRPPHPTLAGVDRSPLPSIPLTAAAAFGPLELVKRLVDAGAKVDPPSGVRSPLWGAAYSLKFDIVKYLLSVGANPAGGDAASTADVFPFRMPMTGLHGDPALEYTKAFIEAGVPINQKDAFGTPLQWVILYTENDGGLETVKLLVKHGAEINPSYFGTGPSPLALAVKTKQEETTKFLLSNGADLCDLNMSWPLLHIALRNYQPQIFDLLLSLPGINLEATEENGMTVLLGAVFYNQPEPLEKLLAAGANPNPHIDDDRPPPLYHVIENDCNERLIKALVDGGASHAPYDIYSSPLDAARKQHAPASVIQLLRNGASEYIQAHPCASQSSSSSDEY